jgi:hypothetical protein
MSALYSYDGPVLEFDREIARRWCGQTYAPTEARARSNLAYQFKRETGRIPRSKITLPGKIVLEGDDQNERTYVSSEFAQA